MTGTWLGTPMPGEQHPPQDHQSAARLHVDCDSCAVRGLACGECVISVLLGPPGDVDLDSDEQAALAALAGSGLVPPLRLVSSVPGSDPADDGPADQAADGPDTDGTSGPWDDGWGQGDAQDWA